MTTFHCPSRGGGHFLPGYELGKPSGFLEEALSR